MPTPHQPASPAASESATPAAAPLRVLVIEDSESDFELVCIDLRREMPQMEARRIEDEPGFLDALRTGRWDVILSDHNLPRFSSHRALALLKQEQHDIPFLIVSGTIGEDHAVNAMLAGADDYVMKGSMRRLRPAIDRAIKAAEQRLQQRRAEQSLQDSLERLQTLVAASPLAIVVVDEQHRVSVWNQTAERMLGIPTALAQGQFLEHAREPLLREINLLYKQLCTGQKLVNFSALLERPEGSLVDISVTAAPLIRNDAGASVGMVAFIADVTEQRRLEQARQENEIKLSAITSNLPGVVFQILFHLGERSVMVPYVSEGAHQLFGISADEFTRQPFTLTSLLGPADREQFRETLAQAAASGDTFRWQGRIFPTGQHPRWLYFAASPRPLVMDYTVWDGIIIDITQQKSAEEWLQVSQDELRALSAHMEQVKETERADIAREIHDDLGGTMTKLKADVMLLRKRLKSLARQVEPAASGELENTLVDMQQLLDHAVASTSRIARSLRPAILDLGIVPALEWEIGEFRRRTNLRVNFTCNLEELELDKQAATVIYRVVQEALTNILKHAQAKRVDVELFATDDRITLEIHDNGIGIDAKSLTKPNSFGIRGMNERARILSGWLDVSSAPGKGTTLMLSIPRMMDNPSA